MTKGHVERRGNSPNSPGGAIRATSNTRENQYRRGRMGHEDVKRRELRHLVLRSDSGRLASFGVFHRIVCFGSLEVAWDGALWSPAAASEPLQVNAELAIATPGPLADTMSRALPVGADFRVNTDPSKLLCLLNAFREVVVEFPAASLALAMKRSPNDSFSVINWIESVGIADKISWHPYFEICREFRLRNKIVVSGSMTDTPARVSRRRACVRLSPEKTVAPTASRFS